MLTLRSNGQLYAEVAGFEDMILYSDYLQIHNIEHIIIEPSNNDPLCPKCYNQLAEETDPTLSRV